MRYEVLPIVLCIHVCAYVKSLRCHTVMRIRFIVIVIGRSFRPLEIFFVITVTMSSCHYRYVTVITHCAGNDIFLSYNAKTSIIHKFMIYMNKFSKIVIVD